MQAFIFLLVVSLQCPSLCTNKNTLDWFQHAGPWQYYCSLYIVHIVLLYYNSIIIDTLPCMHYARTCNN